MRTALPVRYEATSGNSEEDSEEDVEMQDRVQDDGDMDDDDEEEEDGDVDMDDDDDDDDEEEELEAELDPRSVVDRVRRAWDDLRRMLETADPDEDSLESFRALRYWAVRAQKEIGESIEPGEVDEADFVDQESLDRYLRKYTVLLRNLLLTKGGYTPADLLRNVGQDGKVQGRLDLKAPGKDVAENEMPKIGFAYAADDAPLSGTCMCEAICLCGCQMLILFLQGHTIVLSVLVHVSEH
jgi:hypothetical protein